jgi:hypothetical protein
MILARPSALIRRLRLAGASGSFDFAQQAFCAAAILARAASSSAPCCDCTLTGIDGFPIIGRLAQVRH